MKVAASVIANIFDIVAVLLMWQQWLMQNLKYQVSSMGGLRLHEGRRFSDCKHSQYCCSIANAVHFKLL
jgi:hypothetical protein